MARRKMSDDEMLDLAERRGFNGQNATVSLVLAEAEVEGLAGVAKRWARCAAWKKDVGGQRVRAAKQSYLVYRLAGHDWSMAQAASGEPATYELAREAARQLGTRAMWLGLSDPASWMGYYLFDADGALVEILEDFCEHRGDASHLPDEVLGSLKVASTGHGIFGSGRRKVPSSKLKTGLDVVTFVDETFRAAGILAQVTGEWGGRPGPVTLDLPGIAADEVERLDFLTGGTQPAPAKSKATLEREAMLEHLRRQMAGGKRRPS